MSFKVIVLAGVMAIAAAEHGYGQGHGHGQAFSSQSILQHAGQGHEQNAYGHQQLQYSQNNHEDQHVDYYAHPKYEFEYSVQDPHTGDNKYQHESRDGDVVHGVYSLHESDGTIRTVKYTADKHSGFNAKVHREGHATHAVPVQQHHYHH